MSLLQKILSANDLHPLPFEQISEKEYAEAFDAALAHAKEHLQGLKAAPAAYANTIEGIEFFKEELDRLCAVFFSLSSAHTSDLMQELAKEVSPKIAELSNDLILDQTIYQKVLEVYGQKEKWQGEERELLEKTYRAFKRNGAGLNEKQKEELREIDRKLSRITHEFSDHVLKATNEYILFIDDYSAIEELPASTLENAKELAKEKNKTDTWAFTLHFPSYFPLMQKCTSETIRKEIWTAYGSKGMKTPYDNRPLLVDIAKLRHARAQLLGYQTHAHFVLEERMAESPENVEKFLKNLAVHSRQAANKDLEDLKAAKKKHCGVANIHPWDVAFYSERVKQEKFGLRDEEVRPYFPLEAVVKGVFEVATRLYKITFEEITAPVYHPEVKTYAVRDAQKKFLGYFYTDFFPRASKRGGAWMTNFLEQGTWSGQVLRPHVSIVCNFSKPSSTAPSLLTMDEVRTIFHEFGHALHSLLTDCKYTSLSGTNVYWDFVELPSQIMENWAMETLPNGCSHAQRAGGKNKKERKIPSWLAMHASVGFWLFGFCLAWPRPWSPLRH